MVEDKKKTEEEVSIVQVATQTEPGYKLPNGDVVSLPEYLVWMGNLLYKTNKAVA